MGKNGRKRKNGEGKSKKKKKKSSTAEETLALSYIRDWVFPKAADPSASSGESAAGDYLDDFLPVDPSRFASPPSEPVVFDLHSHSTHSDGFLSPSALVLRAHNRGVKVLALTDHDTMSGIPEAIAAASKFGMRIIPGVEISALYSPNETVHILAYYSPCGPSSPAELESMLSSIREGRYTRAKNILLKLQKLKLPLKWEHVARIAGEGVAPGRLHIARAMVEIGYVENTRTAFNKYLSDDGPAYSIGSEPSAERVVELIKRTGGVSALAHPWCLKNPVSIIRALASCGLNALEVYRSDGKVAVFGELADNNGLIKIGGSDFHGKGEKDEAELGSVSLSINTLFAFLKIARPIWCHGLRDIFNSFVNDPCEDNLKNLLRFGKCEKFSSFGDFVDRCVDWLSQEERRSIDLEGIRGRISDELFCR